MNTAIIIYLIIVYSMLFIGIVHDNGKTKVNHTTFALLILLYPIYYPLYVLYSMLSKNDKDEQKTKESNQGD